MQNITNETVLSICKALSDKSALDIKVVEVKGMSDIADYLVVCSGRSAPQVKALFDHLEATLEKLGRFAVRHEGASEGRWICVDYGDIIVHIFHKETRDVYALDTLWNNGQNVTTYVEE
ncbi:MAG: ribosome silencing factor [Clostridia bacterium]|nr:ribosome silencing factor [Clostridia bacterium]MBR1955239.1 ribosome silencing factor [Clostridia bacterium]MBR2985406.1 ribosome silencing factor [Clostridia bacterium]